MNRLKLSAKDGKMCITDVADSLNIFLLRTRKTKIVCDTPLLSWQTPGQNHNI